MSAHLVGGLETLYADRWPPWRRCWNLKEIGGVMKRRRDKAAAKRRQIHRMELLSFQVKKRARRCCACNASYTSGFR